MLIATYVGVTLIVLAPVLFASIGADDSYWIMQAAAQTKGSVWQGIWIPLSHVFDLGIQPAGGQYAGQARLAALGFSERNVIGVLAMNLATYFSIPPAVIWAAVKIGLLTLGAFAVVAFLRQLKFRDGHGQIKGIQPASIAFITIAFPLTVALGAKAQNVASLNGWVHYPTLSYGPFVVHLLVTVLVLKSSALLHRNYRVWAAPIIIAMAFIALVINLSYELLALSIPLCVMMVLLQPLSAETTFWRRWRSKLTILVSLAGTYTAIFVWIRWRISQMECHLTDTCYPGSVPEFNARTVLYNFVGAFPGRTGAFVEHQASTIGRSFPEPSSLSVGVAALGAIALLGIWACWNVRRKVRATDGDSPEETAMNKPSDDIRGLLIVIAAGLVIALGSAVISGITANAVQQLQTPILSYRTGVVTWSALALSGLASVRLLMLVRWRVVRFAALVAFLAVLVGGISLYLPRNIMTAQADRASARTQSIDTLHWEVVLGDPSPEGDARRCESIITYRSTYKEIVPRVNWTVVSAYAAYDYYHGKPYCSTGEGLQK